MLLSTTKVDEARQSQKKLGRMESLKKVKFDPSRENAQVWNKSRMKINR